MFGFSLTKLLFTAAVVAAIWYGYKWIGRIQSQRAAEDKLGGNRPRPGPAAVEDMIRCPVCDSFVTAHAAVSCGRDDCPYPG
jgi:uncharacterized protein